MKTQLYWPDTCDCELEEYVENGEITGGKVRRKCDDHATVPDEEVYEVITGPTGENKRKNIMERILLGYEAVDVGVAEDVTDERGNTIKQWKPGIKYEWSFSGTGKDRTLIYRVSGKKFTAAQKAALKAECDTKFGLGKVIEE